MLRSQHVACRVIAYKMSSCQGNATSRLGIKHLGIFFWFYFSSIYPMKVAGPGPATFIVTRGNPRPLPLNDSPGILSYVDVVINNPQCDSYSTAFVPFFCHSHRREISWSGALCVHLTQTSRWKISLSLKLVSQFFSHPKYIFMLFRKIIP